MTATVFHRLVRPLPGPLRARIQPLWNRLRMYQAFRRRGGRLVWDRELRSWMGWRPMADGRPMPACVRSWREFRRLHFMGHDRTDAVWKWLHWIGDGGRVLYDVGSANGMEGLLANHLHGINVVMVEPYTPSIESILKSIHAARRGGRRGEIEVVHAACGDRDGYGRLLMHAAPVPGETMNSFEDPSSYCNPEDRAALGVVVSQWIKSVTLDELHWQRGLPAPTHVKIDVDGFEGRVLAGAARLLAERIPDSWAIEVTGQSLLDEVGTLLPRHGYVEVDRY
ncbi:MAG: FkbM family methyltransferase, partial [Alphaproteobacteria bacterium]|nr:FkbM family methyltransferase [Alphaproteobacteria bacterium]